MGKYIYLLESHVAQTHYCSAFIDDSKCFHVYYCHKVKHITFENTTKVLETVRTETFERYEKFIVVDNKDRIPAI